MIKSLKKQFFLSILRIKPGKSGIDLGKLSLKLNLYYIALKSYVHRTHSINNIIKTLTEKQTSEQFIADIYAPAINQNNFSASTKRDNQEINFDNSKISF